MCDLWLFSPANVLSWQIETAGLWRGFK